MNLKPVDVKGLYKRQYVKYYSHIYNVNYAKNIPYLKDVNFDEVMNSNDKFEFPYYFIYPSNQKMKEKLEKRREEIYNALRLHKITGKDADIIKAYVLFKFLSSFYDYNMLIQEKRVNLKPIYKKIDELNELKNKNPDNMNKSLSEIDEFKEITKNINQKYLSAMDRNVYIHCYNALIYGKGVCADVTYAYNFLLDGLGIKSIYYVFSLKEETIPQEEQKTILKEETATQEEQKISQKDRVSAHAVSLVKRKGKDEYYFVDATNGRGTVYESYGFASEKNLNDKMDPNNPNKMLEATFVVNEQINEQTKMSHKYIKPENFIKLFDKIVDHNSFSKAIEYGADFIKNRFYTNEEISEFEK